jgi:hypothetical protein
MAIEDDPLWGLYLRGLELCVDDVITEAEHNEFCEWVEAVWARREAEKGE